MTQDTDWRTIPSNQLTAAQRVERDAYIWELYKNGRTIRAIAPLVNLSKTRVGEILDEIALEISQPAKEALIERELELLGEAQQVVLASIQRRHLTVSNGRVVTHEGEALEDDAPLMAAIDRLVKIQDRRAKYLGLDTSVKVDTNISVTPPAILDLIAGIEKSDSNE